MIFLCYQFSSIEEPVRRKVYTSSTANRGVIRGFVVTPNELDFGILKEGCTYSVHCDLKNVGIDTCRFKIKAPPPSTGIKVLYTPGYVSSRYTLLCIKYMQHIMFMWLTLIIKR